MTDRPVQTRSLRADPAGLAAAADILRAGGLVAFPTETVYGLGADAGNGGAVARIFAAKGRPQFNPLIVHVPDLDAARDLAEFDDRALDLARAFWPGPLTLVLPRRAGAALSPLVSAGLDTVAIRVPEAPVAQALLRAAGRPIAAPSANLSGRISATRAGHVLDGLAGRIDAVVDGGACAVGIESTILGLVGAPVLLRPGGLPLAPLSAALGQTPLPHTPAAGTDGAQVSAPGQLASHYAPQAALRLNVAQPAPDALWLGFGPATAAADLSLSPSGDLVEAAANLFDHLHALDARARPGQHIAVAPVPETGLGQAINDRLRRAAAPRP